MTKENLKEEISPEKLIDFFKSRDLKADFREGAVILESTYDSIDYEMKFLPDCSMKPKVSVLSQWPASVKELKRMFDRNSKTITAFSCSENDPRYQLSHPVDEDELEYFLNNLRESKSEIEDAFDNLAYEIRQLRKTLEADNER